MRIVLCALVSLSVLAWTAPPTDAGTYTKRHGYQKKPKRGHASHYQARREGSYDTPYYEHIADKLPIGSLIWWEQMRREGRLGRSR